MFGNSELNIFHQFRGSVSKSTLGIWLYFSISVSKIFSSFEAELEGKLVLKNDAIPMNDKEVIIIFYYINKLLTLPE